MAPALSIKLRCASWQQLSVIYKRDLVRQQIFLKTQTPPPIGTPVRIDLTLPSETTVSMTGEIAAHVPASDSRGSGIDVRLAPLAPNSMWLIESALASEAKMRHDSKSDAQVALSDRHELAHAEGELVSALSSEIESLRRLNPFQVLGLGYEASDTDVRAAFAELTKRYHPDRFARYQSPEPRRLAAEIFILIRDSYRKLGDPQTRATTLAAIGRAGDPRAIPVLRTGAVPVMPRGSSQVISRASIPARPDASPLPGTPLASAASAAGAASGTPAAGSPIPPAGPQAQGQHAQPSPPYPLDGPTVSPPRSPPPLPASSQAAHASHASPPAGPRAITSAVPLIKAIGDVEYAHLEQLLDAEAYDEALATFKSLAKRAPGDRQIRAGIELCEGFRALLARDRLEAAQKFEAVLEIDPSNERAARQLAEMRRQATNERKGLLSRLMGKKE
jgi:tetratricopeptide (TPR) repeat protein